MSPLVRFPIESGPWKLEVETPPSVPSMSGMVMELADSMTVSGSVYLGQPRRDLGFRTEIVGKHSGGMGKAVM